MMVRPWPAPPDLRLTAHVVAGRYRLDELVGRGGAADVYEGRDLRLRRPVAVKVFRPGSESQTEERFDGEGRLLAQLQHPGLVTVYDSGQEDGRPYLVMQLIKGATLRRHIAAGLLTPAEASRIGAALASALAHVHAAGVVHRDVKPSNILLDETGTPHLTDFGISRLLDTTATHTAPGTLVGTAAYMAPEQVLGRGAGPAADIYSLGLVLLESLKGELEYAGAPLEAAIARLHRPPVIPSDLPADLVALLEAMTDPDETRRPDAQACFRALAAMPGGDSASSRREAGPPIDVRNAGEDRNAADVTLRSEFAGARTGATGPVLAATPSEGPPPQEPLSTTPASPRSGRGLLAAGAALAVLGVSLTGSIGALPSEGEDAASRPPRLATTQSPSAGADRTTEPSSPRAGHPDPSSSPAATPAVSRSRTMPSPTAKGSTTKPRPTADEREDSTPAATLKGTGSRKGEAAKGPVRVEPEPRTVKAKPPKKNRSD
ncbi:protein kinase [Streptomyces lateritius]|uniref:non-specific serine/threonine protein kinase n=1 Tax=Streptomyces lateritius TaxID=67313 RepID=A0ABW6YMB8_9ACTN